MLYDSPMGSHMAKSYVHISLLYTPITYVKLYPNSISLIISILTTVNKRLYLVLDSRSLGSDIVELVDCLEAA